MITCTENITKKKCGIASVIVITVFLCVVYLSGWLYPLQQYVINAKANGAKQGFAHTSSYQSSGRHPQKSASPEYSYDNDRNSTNHPTDPSSAIIMCLIFTTVEQYDRKGLAVKLTWLQRCNYYAFFYSKSSGRQLQGAYGLDIPEGRDHLTAKTMKALQVSYRGYEDKVDWYFKADDDTYVIMENLRYLLSHYDPTKPTYLGHTSQDFLKNGYNSGGAGYVLSKAATRVLVEKGDAFPETCPVDGGTEDLDIGRCLETFRIFPEETRDSFHRITFHPDHPLKLLLGNVDAMSVYQYTVQNYTFGHYKGIKVLSPYTISFHYMEPGHMYMYDFLLYDLKRYH